MMRHLKTFVLATLVGWLILGTAVAAPMWLRYRTSDDGPRIVVRARCIAYEDSAAHLKLVEFSSDRIVYGCYKKGY